MEHLERKPNRLIEYDYRTNGAYFVTICTHDRKKMLSSIVGDGFSVPKPFGIIAEEMLKQIPLKYPSIAVEKYVIMPDHIHILLLFDGKMGTENPSPTLGNVVGWYKYQVTKGVDSQFGLNGAKLFQRSYYDHIIRNQRDYDEVWEYMENNPRQCVLDQKETK